MTFCQVEFRAPKPFETRVVDQVPTLPSAAYMPGTLVVLVHGFATKRADAERRYREFAKQVTSVSRKRLVFLAVHWPGDHPAGKPISVPTFSLRVGPAETTGLRVASMLAQSRARSVLFVGHSLGCRVVLSAMAALRAQDSGVQVGAAYLMAAAVPESDCWDAAAYARSKLTRASQIVRSSKKDTVLERVFRLGMFLSRGFAPGFGQNGGRAVGRACGPSGRWVGGWWANSTELGHENYWPSRDMARQFAIVTGNARANTPPRSLISAHELRSRGLRIRDLAG